MSLSFKSLHGIDLVVLPDDHKYFKGVPPGFVATNGRRAYIRESESASVLESLRLTTATIDKAKASSH